MALSDEIKREREKVKKFSPKEKWDYYWSYYKRTTFTVITVVLVALSMLHAVLTQKDVELYVVLLNVMDIEENATEFRENLDEILEIGETNEVVFETSMLYDSENISEDVYYLQQKIAALVTLKELDAIITDSLTFYSFAYGDWFGDLREVLTDEEYNKYKDDFFYMDLKVYNDYNDAMNDINSPGFTFPDQDPQKPEEMDEPVPIGIYLSSDSAFRNAYHVSGGEAAIVGIVSNTQRIESTKKFLEMASEEN